MPEDRTASLATTVTEAPALSARGLTCGYRGVPVVRELDLDVAPGEIVALLGANGAGKSTTLLTLAGVLPAIGGTISLLGRPVRGPLQRRARAGLGFLKESTSVFPSLTVAQNLAIGPGRAERVLEIAPMLRDLRGRKAGLLSGGEQRILVVARALAADPKVLLVDELSLGLAPRITEQLLTLLREHADRGAAILLVEQHPASALAIAQRAAVLRRGRLVHESTAAELASRLDGLHDLYFGS
jgi:ABC-type branched-subunit amino acid transport system ATPase component